MNESLNVKSQNRQIWFYVYYAVLLLILTSWRSTTSAPATAFRIAFMAAVVIPVFFVKQTWLPAIITLFKTFTEYGFAYSYMPTLYYYYIAIVFMGLLLLSKKQHVKIPLALMLFGFYSLIVNLYYGNSIRNIHYCIFIIISFCILTGKGDETMSEKMELAFAICTLVLSAFFFIMRDQFMYSYMDSIDMERIGWIDPNYFGMVLGMGTIASLIALYRRKLFRIEKYLYLFTVLVSAVVLVMNASRGALLSTFVAAGLAVLFSKQKLYIRLSIILIGVIFVFVALKQGVFDLVLYRVENDDDGSGRLFIWTSKLQAFFQLGLSELLFGVGSKAMGVIASSFYSSSHNDYISALISFGFIGLVLFLSMVFYPFWSVMRKKGTTERIFVLVPTVFILLNGMTLEPLNQGRLPYWCFYYYLILLASEIRLNAKKE